MLSDAHELAEATKQFLDKKNPDENLQRFTEETKLAGVDANQRAKQEAQTAKEKGLDMNEVRSSATQAGQAALNMIKMMIKNGEFRGYMLDLTKLFQDILLNSENQENQQQHLEQTQQPIAGTTPMVEPTTQNAPTMPHDPLIAAHMHTSTVPGDASITPTTPATGTALGTGVPPTTEGDKKNWMQTLSPQRKQELSYRFLSLIRKMSADPQLKSGLQSFNKMLKNLIEDSKNRKVGSEAQQNEHVQSAFTEAKQILHNLSGQPVEPLFENLNTFNKSLQSDEKMRTWLSDVQHLLRDTFQHPDSIDEKMFVNKTEELIERGRVLMQEIRLRDEYRNILFHSRAIWENMRADPEVQNLTQKFQQFMENFTYMDENGKRQFNREVLQDLRQFLVPLMMKLFDKIPVPPNSGSNDTYDYRVENIVISGYDIVPEQVELHTSSDVSMNVHKLGADSAGAFAQMRIHNIKTKIEDIKFWFKRKSFPKIEDEGVADVILRGDGMNVVIDFSIKGEAGAPRFHLENCHVDIDNMKVNIKEAHHDFLLKMVTTLFGGAMKRNMTRTMEEKIESVFHNMEEGMNRILQKYPPSKLKNMAQQQMTTGTNM